jgi:hypothetical protein
VAICVVGFGRHLVRRLQVRQALAQVQSFAGLQNDMMVYMYLSAVPASSITGHLADRLSLAALIVDQSVVSLGSVRLNATTESGRGSYKAIGIKTRSVQQYFADGQSSFSSK